MGEDLIRIVRVTAYFDGTVAAADLADPQHRPTNPYP